MRRVEGLLLGTFAVYIDLNIVATCTSVSVSLLVGVLVFSSVLELVRRQDTTRYSLDDQDVRTRVETVRKMVLGIVYLASGNSVLGFIAMAMDTHVLRIVTLIFSSVTICLFAFLAHFTVRWLWR